MDETIRVANVAGDAWSSHKVVSSDTDCLLAKLDLQINDFLLSPSLL